MPETEGLPLGIAVVLRHSSPADIRYNGPEVVGERIEEIRLPDLLPERTAPELLYLESQFASLMSYGLSVKLLADALPIDERLNAATIRNHTQRLGDRLDAELGEEQFMFAEGCPRDWEALPHPDIPLTVGIDGDYVHSREQPVTAKRSFEIIVGKSIPDEDHSRTFSSVENYDEKPKRWLFELLKAKGMQMNQVAKGIKDKHPQRPSLHPQLWRSLSEWRADLNGVCGVYGQSGRQPADGQETADALEPQRGTFIAAGQDSCFGWRVAEHVRALVRKV